MDELTTDNKNPWTFYKWLANFKDVDLPIGDLAQDILGDSNFPTESNSFQEIYDHLCDIRANSRMMQTFLEVWYFYSYTERSNSLVHY